MFISLSMVSTVTIFLFWLIGFRSFFADLVKWAIIRHNHHLRKFWMILRAITSWVSMILSRKTITVITLGILAYLYWLHDHHEEYIASNGNDIDKSNAYARENALFADFMETWCRVKRMRMDWKKVLRPCADHMAWGEGNWGQQNKTDAAKSYLTLWDIRPAGQFSRFDIQSVTRDNINKKIGGDSWRVHIRGPSSMSPTVIDHNNGKYEVSFLVLEPGKYDVEVVLEYSLCDGYKDPPKDWFIEGQWLWIGYEY